MRCRAEVVVVSAGERDVSTAIEVCGALTPTGWCKHHTPRRKRHVAEASYEIVADDGYHVRDRLVEPRYNRDGLEEFADGPFLELRDAVAALVALARGAR